MKYTITGDNLQFVNVQLEPGEELMSTAGSMSYMTGNVRMEAKMEGGLFKGVKRMFSGESLFLVKYHAEGGSGIVGLGGDVPGKIMDIDVTRCPWIVQKTGYLGSEPTVDLDIAFQKKLGNMLFGGEGLFVATLTGPGKIVIQSMTLGDMAMALYPFMPKNT